MKQITDNQELRGLQMAILNEVHHFCEEHGLTYFLSSGTLIGAVRHGGYIPWDDDIDIYMPRESYDRLVKEYCDPSGKYELLDPRKQRDYFYTFAKMVDNTTVMVEDWYKNFPIGVYIDIFPLDYVTDSLWKRKLLFMLKKQLFRVYIDKQVDLLRDHKLWNIIKRFVCKLIPLKASWINSLLRYLQVHDKPTHTVCNMTEVGPSVKGCFPAEYAQSMVDIVFEGKTYKTMNGYKKYLEYTYGDYMQLPPEDQRQSHKFIAYYK